MKFPEIEKEDQTPTKKQAMNINIHATGKKKI